MAFTSPSRPVKAGFRSILFDRSGGVTDTDGDVPPDYFADLRLDQVVASITGGRHEYDLAPFFHSPLTSVETVVYRQDVFRDLEDASLRGFIRSFAERMRATRVGLDLSARLYFPYEQERWFLSAGLVYCEAVTGLARELEGASLRSRGLLAFRDFLADYIGSAGFAALRGDTQRVMADLDGIRYRLQINGPRVKVSRYEPAPDYSADVLKTFEKFKQGSTRDYTFTFPDTGQLNHVEGAILDLVARLHPNVFRSLDEYCERHHVFVDETIARFDREVQFYVSYLEHIEGFRSAGLPFCYPEVGDRSKEIHGRDVFDLALASVLRHAHEPMVTNDFHLEDPERILVVSGPNQGGKTTFARTIGQLHHLARIGCLVPGSEARLFLVDRILAHFEREEDLQNLSGKLEDDLRRFRVVLEHATPNSLLVMNESFGSTTVDDALFLNKEVMRQVIERDMLCVSVTFLDELATLSLTTVSMVSTIDPDDPATRTFKIVRRPADGLAYAAAIARKYRLTYESVKERIAP